MNEFAFRAKERLAFKEEQERGLLDIEWEAPAPISAETCQMFRSMEETNTGLWSGLRGKSAQKQLIKAAKTKSHPKDHKGFKDTEKQIFNGHLKKQPVDIIDGITPTNDII